MNNDFLNPSLKLKIKVYFTIENKYIYKKIHTHTHTHTHMINKINIFIAPFVNMQNKQSKTGYRVKTPITQYNIENNI